MEKIKSTFANWFARKLNRLAALLEEVGRPVDGQGKFVDLAPIDEADKAGVYSKALLYATNNERVSNIALTGPYGSGKSSVIQTFLNKYRRPALHISLAAFIPEGDSAGEEVRHKVSRQEIERSILQQMLYGADTNKLPLSRFKRIQSPSVWSIFKSLYIMLGILAFWYVFLQREYIISGTFFAPFALSNWFNLGSFGLATIFLWMTLHYFYVASFGVSLKSISLKDIEIRPASDNQDSILNRHLDEIIYFFQSTNYDLVIIEDLDRFNNPDIFVTLREINSLVNANAGVKRTIRFLYALRDDMFVNTERTKFFEFIIPVIPIINSSNSIDMVLEQGSRLELDGRLDRQFLREVSRYLNDLRLIQNIFNEYSIYVDNLETDGENLLDANKLLAVLIYKNFYPRDFEQLHRGEGDLARILNLQDELISHGEVTYRAEIAELERRLEIAEMQTPSNLNELRQVYTMALIEELPANVVSVKLNQRALIALAKIAEHDEFEQLIGSSNLFIFYQNGHSQRVNIPNIQYKVDSQKTYHQRKVEIESKETDKKNEIHHQLRDLRSKIATLRTTKLNELLRLNAKSKKDVFENFGKNGELARFLILEGYLDDTYYQYTSLFHSGRLSPSDNKFLIHIRAFVTPEPSFSIDNPKEVIAAMRAEDFRQNYVLNVKLVDSLLSDRSRYLDQTQKFFEFISSEFESCEEFFDVYYVSGRYVGELIFGLSRTWKCFIPVIIASPNNIIHATQLIEKLPEDELETLVDNFEELSVFISSNLSEILANSPELEPERLECLYFEVRDFSAIKEHSGVVRFMFEKGLFELTISNLEYAYQAILGENDLQRLRESNFTTIRSINSAVLMKRIESDFDSYFRGVLLALEENTKEDAESILAVIRQDKLEQDDLQVFLERQASQLPALDDVPTRLHSMLFKLNKIEPTWLNCLDFMGSDGFEENSLAEYLDRDDVREIILETPMLSDSDSLDLRWFLIKTNSLSDVNYREYVHALPREFKGFPEGLELNKLRILIDEGKIMFSKENLDVLTDNIDLQVLFVATNIDTYLADPDSFNLDDGFREELLQSEVDHVAKCQIVKLMDLEQILDRSKRSALIAPIINNSDINMFNLNGNIAKSLIENANSITMKISLFNKCHSLMTGEEVRCVLSNLPRPFSEIKTGYNSPRLKNNTENLDLVSWLKLRSIISTWSEGSYLLSDDIKVNLYRR